MNLLRFPFKSDLRIFSFVFGVILVATIIHVVRQPRVYEASGTFRFQSPGDADSHRSGLGVGDWNEIRVALKSSELIQRVVTERFTKTNRADFLAPYDPPMTETEGLVIERLIRENQQVSFDRLESAMIIRYQHPDRMLAAHIVNLLIDEVLVHQARRRIDEAMKAVEELKVRAESQQRHVRELAAEMSSYRERHEKISGAPIKEDAQYQRLHKQQADAQKMLDALISRMRATTMITGMGAMGWRVADKAVAPDEGDYLKRPIVVRLIWGLLPALSCGFVAVWGVRKCGRRNSDADVVEGAANEGGGS